MDRLRDNQSRPRDGGRDSAGRAPTPGPSSSNRQESSKERGRSTTKPSASEHKATAQLSAAQPSAAQPSAAQPSAAQPSPAATLSRSESVPSGGGSLRADVKRVTEFLSERLFWYMKRDTAEKKLQKVQFDMNRCQGTFDVWSSAAEILRQQKDAAEEEKTKCCTRLEAADESLQQVVKQLVAKLPLSRPEDAARPFMEHKSSERPGPNLDARLAAAQRSTETSFAKMLAEESSAIKRSLRKEFETTATELKSQAGELKALLLAEKLKNEALKENFRALDEKINKSARDVDPKARSQSQRALELALKVEKETQDLVSRKDLDESLRKLDRALSLLDKSGEDDEMPDEPRAPGEETALKLRHFGSKLGNLESGVDEVLRRVQNLGIEVDGHAGAIRRQTDQQLETNSAIQNMESLLAQTSANQATEQGAAQTGVIQEAMANDGPVNGSEAAPATVSDEHIQRISRIEVQNVLREFLPTISNKLATFLKEERVKRELVGTEADKAAVAAAALRKELDEIKQECTRSFQELAHQTAKFNSEFVSSKQQLETLEATCSGARAGTTSEVEELAMQVRDVQSWQDNFTTKPLYKDIVDHINATLPNGVLNQLRDLANRVTGVECHINMGEGGDAKRRRVEAANPGQQGNANGTA